MASSGGERFGRMAARHGKARRGPRGRVSGGRGAQVAHGAQRGGAGQLRLGTWPVRVAGASGKAKIEQSRAGGLEVDEGTDS
jgi:hypothetical protein